MDEFSFPSLVGEGDSTLHHPFPHLTSSPSIWHHEDDGKPAVAFRRSISSVQTDGELKRSFTLASPTALSDDERLPSKNHGEDERMDMLWEDFNEDLRRSERRGVREGKAAAVQVVGSGGGAAKQRHRNGYGRLWPAAAGLPKGGGRLVVMLRMLKKAFQHQKCAATHPS